MLAWVFIYFLVGFRNCFRLFACVVVKTPKAHKSRHELPPEIYLLQYTKYYRKARLHCRGESARSRAAGAGRFRPFLVWCHQCFPSLAQPSSAPALGSPPTSPAAVPASQSRPEMSSRRRLRSRNGGSPRVLRMSRGHVSALLLQLSLKRRSSNPKHVLPSDHTPCQCVSEARAPI